MKKLAILALIVAGCSRNPGPGSQLTGAAAPRLAAEAFMKAVAAQDLQAMSVVWGTEKGAARDQLDRTELDRRLIVIQSCYAHDRYTIGDETPGPNGHRFIKVSIHRGRNSRTPNFEMVKGPSDRWYVQDADFDSMQGMCRPASQGTR
ncbi:MAG: hypothetical protein JNL26_19630 [Gemmatimonadetes bacterium]|nr:hypothetical protein [Gemmatimonadota bacterium]